MKNQNKKSHYGLIMTTYLLGIFMGAIDTGIVTPARTVIQNNLSVDEKTGIWIITIYTLAYAASIPIMGKLADKFGRKYIYLSSIFLFGVGSLLCGLSQSLGSFTFLLIARAIQAIGGGGILPIATAEFGTTFPEQKRGMALGLVGGVYGIANIFGASAGSAILDLFGKDNWCFIFYVNIPITIFILIAGFLRLPNTKEANVKKIDFIGITILTVMILSLLYGLKNIDFFNLGDTIKEISVYPFLIIFIILLPFLMFAEKKAEDPVLNLSYFKNSKIIITLFLSFISGFLLMGMVFVPQFSENAVKISSGSGGYFVLILALFSGIGAPTSGKLIDKFGVKIILGFGFIISAIGSIFLVLITASYPNMFTVIIGLIFTGIGIGFTMGTPLNYMMLDNTKKEESNSAMATVSLIRSIGTAIAPAIMIGFIAHAGFAVQSNVMNLLPKEVAVPPLPYAQELTDQLNKLKTNPSTKDKFAKINIPDLTSMQKIEININANSNYKMPEDLIALMKSSDVTTITNNSKTLADKMFTLMTPNIISNIGKGIDSGINGINTSLKDIEKNRADMQNGYDGLSAGIKSMQAVLESQKTALKQMNNLIVMVSKIPHETMNGQNSEPINIVSMVPKNIKNQISQSVMKELNDIKTIDDLNNKKNLLIAVSQELSVKLEDSKKSQEQMSTGIDGLKTAQKQMSDTIVKMNTLKDAIPSSFETAKINYLTEIENKKVTIENEFQKTLNGGFKQVYLTVTIASIIALIILTFYKKKKEGVS